MSGALNLRRLLTVAAWQLARPRVQRGLLLGLALLATLAAAAAHFQARNLDTTAGQRPSQAPTVATKPTAPSGAAGAVATPAAVENTRAALQRYYAGLAPQSSRFDVIGRLLETARLHRVFPAQGDYALQADPRSQTVHYQVTLPLKGPATQVEAFVRDALAGQSALALESLTLERSDVHAAEVEGQAQFVFWMAR